MESYAYSGNGEDIRDFLSAQPNGIVSGIEIEYNLKLGKAYIRTANAKILELLNKNFRLQPVSAEDEFLSALAPERKGWIVIRK